jgi:RNA methyltransferase, TrmH family
LVIDDAQELAPGVLERVATTEHPQGVIGVAHLPAVDVVAPTFVVVLAGVSDPGNAGTILRAAEASGADAVVALRDTVDLTNPKTVRASAGAIFHVPILHSVPRGLVRIGAIAHGGVEHTAADLTRPCAIVLGSEAHGIAVDVEVDEKVTIAHAGRAESLNVAMAAAVLCFEVARQRRLAPGSRGPVS